MKTTSKFYYDKSIQLTMIKCSLFIFFILVYSFFYSFIMVLNTWQLICVCYKVWNKLFFALKSNKNDILIKRNAKDYCVI